MSIYLKEKSNKKSSFQFPSNPERIEVKSDTKYQEYNIINKGTYAFPVGNDVQIIQWKGIFWGEQRKTTSLTQKWISPGSCIKKLEQWRAKKTILNLIVSEAGINKDVTIKSFKSTPYGGYGDSEYTIVFASYGDLTVYTTDELDLQSSTKKKTVERETKKKSKTYTVGDNGKNDTLWSIAQYFYGDGLQWKKIYDANKNIIESTAQKYGMSSSDEGWWIFDGCVLTIP